MSANNRNRQLVIKVSQRAYNNLQQAAVDADRHTTNYVSDILELALLELERQPTPERKGGEA